MEGYSRIGLDVLELHKEEKLNVGGLVGNSITKLTVDLFLTEHARLKDHVSSMDGGLEAKINEGGKQHSFLF